MHRSADMKVLKDSDKHNLITVIKGNLTKITYIIHKVSRLSQYHWL